MTISSIKNRDTVAGDDTTGPFTIDINSQAAADITVTHVDTSGTETLYVLDTDYTLNAARTQVTTTVALATGESLIITIGMDFLQSQDRKETGTLSNENIETAIDKLTLQDQEMSEELDRTIKFEVSASDTDVELPATSGNGDKYLKLNSGATAFEYSTLSSSAGLGNIVEDTSPQSGGDHDMNGHQMQWSKGADVASAAALPVLTDGNYFDVTGTTTITSINTTGGAGTVICLHFDGVLTLTHHATDLILPGGANITTAAGDEFIFIEYATGDYRCIGYALASGKAIIGSDLVDDTTPQLGGDLDLNGNNIDFPTTANISDCLDEDNMASDSATALATQQSIKAYVDSQVSSDWELISSATASSSSSIDFTGLSSTYFAYKIVASNVVPASDTVDLYFRTSTDGGSTYDSGASDYAYAALAMLASSSPSNAAVGDNARAEINVTASTSLGSGTNESIDMELTIFNPSGTGHTRVLYQTFVNTSAPAYESAYGAGVRLSAADVDAVRFVLSSGNIASGEFRLYGIKGA
jgi:hypothetical protein